MRKGVLTIAAIDNVNNTLNSSVDWKERKKKKNSFVFKIKIVIATFRFSIKFTLKLIQTSLLLFQWSLK